MDIETYRPRFSMRRRLGRETAGLNLIGAFVAGGAVLQGREAVAVQDRVGVSGIRRQTLADEQAGLAMRVSSSPRTVRSAASVTSPGDLLPNKVKGVVGGPHVGPAAREEVGIACRIEFHRAGVLGGADVVVILEQPDGLGIRRRDEGQPGNPRRLAHARVGKQQKMT